MSSLRFILSLAALFLAGPLARNLAAQNLVLNPGFESGVLNPWTVSTTSPGGPATDIDTNAADAFAGGYSVFFAQTSYVDSLSQSIATDPGQAYTLTFRLAANPSFTPDSNAVQQFEVLWNGSTVYSRTDSVSMAYQLFTVNNLTASGASSLLTLNGQNAPGAYYLDEVSLVASSLTMVPEPSTWVAAAGASSACLLLGRRRCRRQPTA